MSNKPTRNIKPTRGTRTRRFGSSARVNHDSSEFYDARLYTDLGEGENQSPIGDGASHSEATPFPDHLRNMLITGSAEDMSTIPDRSLHLMVTSPPYNVSKEYDTDLSLAEYLGLLENVFRETYRVLVDGGRACVNVANLGRRPYIPLSDYISHMMLRIGFRMRGEIIWSKGAGAGVSMAWGSWRSASNPVLRDTHEYILVFSKGAFGRAKTGESTITREQFMEWTKSVWTMNTASAKKIGHPAPFPVELPHRLIQLYTFKEDIVLDPFMGSGSTALAARMSQRSYIGYDIDPAYIQLAEARLAAKNKL